MSNRKFVNVWAWMILVPSVFIRLTDGSVNGIVGGSVGTGVAILMFTMLLLMEHNDE